MDPWGFAVIGCGTIADFHLKAIKDLEKARLVGVASRREQRAREIGEQERCLWTTDYKEFLNHPEVDIVCLTTSSGSHARIGLEVLEAGKHLLVEKPLAMNVEQSEQMVSLARKKGVVLSVVSQRRFERQHQIVKRVVDEGKIGKILLAEISCPFYRSQDYYDASVWRGTLTEDGGALMNQGIHSIDLLLWMVGEPVCTVYGKTMTLTHRMEAEDMGAALITFQN